MITCVNKADFFMLDGQRFVGNFKWWMEDNIRRELRSRYLGYRNSADIAIFIVFQEMHSSTDLASFIVTYTYSVDLNLPFAFFLPLAYKLRYRLYIIVVE